MAAPIKMDELLVSWLGSDTVYENVLSLIENYRKVQHDQDQQQQPLTPPGSPKQEREDGDSWDAANENNNNNNNNDVNNQMSSSLKDPLPIAAPVSPRGVIPPFYPLRTKSGKEFKRRRTPPRQSDTWDPLSPEDEELANPQNQQEQQQQQQQQQQLQLPKNQTTSNASSSSPPTSTTTIAEPEQVICVRDQVRAIYQEHGQDPPLTSPGSDTEHDNDELDMTRFEKRYLTMDSFVRVTKEVCRLPSFFNAPLYQRILDLWNFKSKASPMQVVTFAILQWYWNTEMEPYDAPERFYRLVKQPWGCDSIVRDDFLPYIKALLNDHPGLEFLSNHAEFQEKYAVTVITRIFYSVNKCHSGRITSRQIRRSDLLEAFQLVDEEEDINKVTRYFSYEHFYVLYCRFWELDHDRDYRITREDLLKYGDHSLSHMIVDRIFDAAPRPFETEKVNREFLSYEDFIYFMLSEEDKANEISVRYWFSCVDVDGDAKLNNMEMRSFYAVQLHRMQCMGHEIVPFEDMLCQMMDMIKPKNSTCLIAEDFLQTECAQVSGALFDALFNLNKYLLFEQRDPFVERQKREDEFETDWDRFACIDYNRLAMEEEAREEEAMEIDWVTVDDEDDDNEEFHDGAHPSTNEAPF